MSAPVQPCQDLCTDVASVATASVLMIGVCDDTVSMPFEDVSVTGCTIQEASASPISDSKVLVSVNVAVDFTAVESSSGIPVSGQCDTHMSAVVTAVNPPATLSDQLGCSQNLACSARYAGYEPNLTPLGAEEFIITVSGTVSCTNCQPAVVNVQLCSSDR